MKACLFLRHYTVMPLAITALLLLVSCIDISSFPQSTRNARQHNPLFLIKSVNALD